MAKPKPQTKAVDAFLAELPPDRKVEIERVRSVVRQHLPQGYEETVVKNMIVYQVPAARYSDTYNGHPLWYVALGAPKSYLTLHLVPVYMNSALAKQLQDGFTAAGKKLDMGKACIHFKRADDLALDAIGKVVASTPVDKWVAIAESARRR